MIGYIADIMIMGYMGLCFVFTAACVISILSKLEPSK